MLLIIGKGGQEMRLIDADVFKEIVGTETKARRMVCNLIDTQPTAYDVEKVVEQLKNQILDPNGLSTFGNNVAIGIAIDIVRNGGKKECK